MIIDIPELTPKMLRETLCYAEGALYDVTTTDTMDRVRLHLYHIQLLIKECDRQRPLGPDGTHGDRHTMTCGCALTSNERGKPGFDE